MTLSGKGAESAILLDNHKFGAFLLRSCSTAQLMQSVTLLCEIRPSVRLSHAVTAWKWLNMP